MSFPLPFGSTLICFAIATNSFQKSFSVHLMSISDLYPSDFLSFIYSIQRCAENPLKLNCHHFYVPMLDSKKNRTGMAAS